MGGRRRRLNRPTAGGGLHPRGPARREPGGPDWPGRDAAGGSGCLCGYAVPWVSPPDDHDRWPWDFLQGKPSPTTGVPEDGQVFTRAGNAVRGRERGQTWRTTLVLRSLLTAKGPTEPSPPPTPILLHRTLRSRRRPPVPHGPAARIAYAFPSIPFQALLPDPWDCLILKTPLGVVQLPPAPADKVPCESPRATLPPSPGAFCWHQGPGSDPLREGREREGMAGVSSVGRSQRRPLGAGCPRRGGSLDLPRRHRCAALCARVERAAAAACWRFTPVLRRVLPGPIQTGLFRRRPPGSVHAGSVTACRPRSGSFGPPCCGGRCSRPHRRVRGAGENLPIG
jgi:hypothetical protein